MIPALLSVIIAFSILGTAVVEVTLTNFSVVGNIIDSQRAFNVSEAGLNYYLWHLNHNATDYKDGNSTPTLPDPNLGYGPYTHNFIDSNGVVEGTYTLWVKPASSGSTIVTVRSIGQAAGTNIKRTVQAQIGSPSFASYAVASDSALWFGNTESADGPVQSNQGVRMDGASNSTVSSANATYLPPSNLGGCGGSNCSHPGVWCDSSVTSPVNCNTRSKSAWAFPVPQIDFNSVTSSLCTIKKVAFLADPSTSALASLGNACSQVPATRTAAYIPEISTTYSSTKGYLIKLNSNGTYDLLEVNSENDQLATYNAALNTTPIATGITIPSSGVIFVEDNAWVISNPTYHGRVTIASGRLADANNTNIVIAGNLLYSAKDGSDAVGLIAEGSVYIAPYAPPASGAFNFEVDGALLAESGSVEYGENTGNVGTGSVYRNKSTSSTRGWVNSNQTFTFYGAVSSRQTWTWTWLGGASGDDVYDASSGYYVSGILHNDTQYDYNLEYAPPPSFPLTSGYNILSWREILTHP